MEEKQEQVKENVEDVKEHILRALCCCVEWRLQGAT